MQTSSVTKFETKEMEHRNILRKRETFVLLHQRHGLTLVILFAKKIDISAVTARSVLVKLKRFADLDEEIMSLRISRSHLSRTSYICAERSHCESAKTVRTIPHDRHANAP